ncbi:MAG: hypothetical protein EZS28_014559 [Streblomastix strix]|uniref:Tubulin--tyrosine ligase-like protein 5 n=1 Tax=Streblomastix strix TaxID=222440 RepID=A0A5J4W4X3_9EUKA|nr:MAG: hypothetical protein EZS28_014559 [Streblomastix strix]
MRNVLNVDDRVVMRRIQDVLIKTFISADQTFMRETSTIQRYPSNCSELYGVDILLDDGMRPYILEVNTSPSMVASGTPDSTALDEVVKHNMLSDMFFMLGHTPYENEYRYQICHQTQIQLLSSQKKKQPNSKKKSKRHYSDRLISAYLRLRYELTCGGVLKRRKEKKEKDRLIEKEKEKWWV